MSARLQVTILGCGASPGVPRIGKDWGACDPREPRNRRRRCAILIERRSGDGRTRVLVDCGPDIREQLLDADIGVIDALVFTHSHADHTHGIDDMRAFWLNTRRRLVTYADAMTFERLEQAFGYCFIGHPQSDYPPILDYHPLDFGVPITVPGDGGPVELMPFRQIHGGINSVGLRIGDLAYSSDISDVPEESMVHLRDLDVWIVDALRYKPHPSHFSVDDALAWIARVAPRRAVLTHLHGDLDYATLSASVPDNVTVAYDGMA
ncbi:MAG: MBL fold metallo-hydrolase, partial [Alphaproteobacteria bacterium]